MTKKFFCLFESPFKIQKNGVFLFEISFFVLEILTFFYLINNKNIIAQGWPKFHDYSVVSRQCTEAKGWGKIWFVRSIDSVMLSRILFERNKFRWSLMHEQAVLCGQLFAGNVVGSGGLWWALGQWKGKQSASHDKYILTKKVTFYWNQGIQIQW